MSWDLKHMAVARTVAGFSKDRSRKTSAVIVSPANDILATGYNGFPRGVNDNIEARHERPAKYAWTEHAERNAIYSAARNGIRLAGSTIYLPWYPCVDCARSIIQSGITTVVGYEPLNWDDPNYSFHVTRTMLQEAGVTIRFLGKGSY